MNGEAEAMPYAKSVQLDHGIAVPFPGSKWMLVDEQYVVCWLDDDTGHQPRALRIYTSIYPNDKRCISIAADNTGIMHHVASD